MEAGKAELLHRKLRHIAREMERGRMHRPPAEWDGPPMPGPHHCRREDMRPEGMMRPEHMVRPEGMGWHHGPRHHGGMRVLPRERILMILAEAGEEGLHQKDIAAVIRINPSSLSEAIDKLETDRYVTREVDPEDRRATLIRLTEKGSARAAEVTDMHNERIRDLFRNLTDEEQETLLALLDKAFPEG